jgi:diaminohydroxyphosphoribosylaminopyrimidine deaminase/5-amino-6-(5-phosphoribosylamino)uracil reductase
MTDRRPHVVLKLALSADGKAGLAGRRPVAITGSLVRNRVHLMRAMSDAVLTGIGTALSDDPLLTCRLPGMGERSPVRIVLDSNLRLPLDGRLVATAREVPLWLVTSRSAPREREEALVARGAAILRTAEPRDLGAVLRLLAERGITRLMVEAGPILSAAFVTAGLVDEAAVFSSPKPLGPDAIDVLEGLPLETLTRDLVPSGAERMGEDTAEVFRRPD